MKFIQSDVFDLSIRQRFNLVYADPPYAGCRFKYARQRNSRRWGMAKRADFLRELIALMEGFRKEEGTCALSMSSPELRLLHLFPSDHHVMAWVKPFAPFRPHVWPAYAWEPLVVWGNKCGRKEQLESKTPRDWLQLSPRVPKKGGHETPKPEEFARWVVNMTLGPRKGTVLDLFAGTCILAEVAETLGNKSTAVDLERKT